MRCRIRRTGWIAAPRQCAPPCGKAKVKSSDVVSIGVDFTSCTMLPTLGDGTPLCQLEAYAREPLAWPKLWKHHARQPPDRSHQRSRPPAQRSVSRRLRRHDRLGMVLPQSARNARDRAARLCGGGSLAGSGRLVRVATRRRACQRAAALHVPGRLQSACGRARPVTHRPIFRKPFIQNWRTSCATRCPAGCFRPVRRRATSHRSQAKRLGLRPAFR